MSDPRTVKQKSTTKRRFYRCTGQKVLRFHEERTWIRCSLRAGHRGEHFNAAGWFWKRLASKSDGQSS